MKTKIIVEASSNHMGDMDIASEMIRKAAECGVDYIKFQSWQSKNLEEGNPNYERHRVAELSDKDHYFLMDECKKNQIGFLTSCFDVGRVDFLAELGLDMIKIPSTETVSHRMLKDVRKKFLYVILSIGAAHDQEIEEAANILADGPFCLMHCVSIYPLPLDKVNMRRMNWLKKFTSDVGFSDHTFGVEAGKMAIAQGAKFFEKHFTINKEFPGKDQQMSATPDIIKELCDYAQLVEEIQGQEVYDIYPEEEEVRKNYIGKWGDNR